jgi:pyruvate/2-oxoglutarate dehydrogenase complex dihydrolipoamide acyltransferase (E2) component
LDGFIPKQVVLDAELKTVEIRHMMFLSLTFDHRLIDGAQAARFLQRVKRLIEKPYLWMAGPIEKQPKEILAKKNAPR